MVPYLLTEHTNVTDGMAEFALHGGLKGIADGAMLYSYLEANDNSLDDRALYASMMVFSIGELVGCMEYARATEMTGGTAAALGSMGWFGGGIGLAGYGMMDNADHQLMPIMYLAGSALGYVAGGAMTNSEYYTNGDAQVLSISGVHGAVLATSLVTLADDEHLEEIGSSVYLGAAIAGAIAGLASGHFAVAGRDFTSSEGLYLGMGVTGGYLIGMGFGVTATNAQATIVGGALGGTLAYMLLMNRYKKAADRRERFSHDRSPWSIQVSPIGLAAAFGGVKSGDVPVPIAGISYRW
jgi:hypothetical protein